MSYTPPAGNAVPLTFTGGPYTPPAGNAVPLEFRANLAPGGEQYVFPATVAPPGFGQAVVNLQVRHLFPQGVLPGPFGGHEAWLYHRWLRPSGIPSKVSFGAAALVNWNKNVDPHGFRADVHGQPKVENKTRYLVAGGLPPRLAFGRPTIFNADRYYTLAGFNANVFGAAFLQGGVVTVEVSPISQPPAPPAPWVSRSPRYLSPTGVFREFPTQHMVGGTRWLQAQGFEATRWGTRIIPESQTVQPGGFSGGYGLADVWNYSTFATPAGFRSRPDDQRFGAACAWNLRQYVRVTYDPNDGLSPPPQDGWTAIYNRNRVIAHHSTAPSLLPRPVVELGARQIIASGIAAPGWEVGYRAGMVAYRVRHYTLGGIEPPYFSGWSRIYNAAPVMTPAGTETARFGTAALVNTRRYFPYIGGFDASWLGYPMVAPRVRTVSFDPRYAIAPPLVRMPEVKLHTRYVDGIGADTMGAGHPSLSIHWRIITPRWTLQHFFGIPDFRNVTPELRARGRNSEEFGDAFVRLQWRPVYPSELYSQRFGNTRIADRLQRIAVAGLNATTVSQLHNVTRTGAPPHTVQNIVLSRFGFYDDLLPDGYGIAPPFPNRVPPPRIVQNIIYVRQGAASTQFGTARADAMGIRVEPGLQELNVGYPLVSAKIRRVEVGEFPDNQVFQPPKVRISPYTIYSVIEAPQQAQENHPIGTDRPHYVNSDRGYRAPGEVFGTTTVRNKHRRVQVRPSAAHTSYGVASLSHRRRYIRPDGIRSYRFGWHEIPGPKTLEQFASPNTAVFGTTTVKFAPYTGPQTVAPRGFSGLFGATRIELLNREVSPAGFVSQAMGTRRANDTPFMWQGLRIGPHVPSSIGGGAQDAHGEPWVSMRVRDVGALGFDAFLCEYDHENFAQRMRVRRYAAAKPIGHIFGEGISSTDVPVPSIRNKAHYILPDGNAEQHRKGAF